MYHFVMPLDGLEPRQIDAYFRPQAEALQSRGYRVSTVPDPCFRRDGELPGVPTEAAIVYRGWMVRPEEYLQFEKSVRINGATLLTDAAAYVATHHLPNWYPALEAFTAETVVVESADNLSETLERLNWDAYFLKDYVKSLKVGGGSIVRSRADAERWVQEMIHYRDELEGGICIRRVETFVPESECRYFVLNGVPYSPDLRPIPLPVAVAAERISSPFFAVDIAQTAEGECRIVELGDGQVSDLVGWSVGRFAEIWPKSEIG